MNDQSNIKVLVITPSIPYPETGAEQSDRAHGIRQLKRIGFDIRVVAKRASFQSNEQVREAEDVLGVSIRTVPYKYSNKTLSSKEQLLKLLAKTRNPRFLDGAALEYAETEISNVVREELDVFKPDFCWFDYTYLWPLYGECKRRNIPIITRSINYEPEHFLDEDGRTIWNYIKTLPKVWSERAVARDSAHIFAITPQEESIYHTLGASASTLPLRGLPQYLSYSHEIRDRSPLKVFFMGSTYNVSHNRAAAEMFLEDIIPEVNRRALGEFEFYIFGKKLPPALERLVKGNVHYMGYQADLQKSLTEMDVAVIPSLFGAGMQQKIFEPLAMGIPTITSSRGIAGYPFIHNEHVLLCESVEDFADGLLELKSVEKRKYVSNKAKDLSITLFSTESIDKMVAQILDNITSRH